MNKGFEVVNHDPLHSTVLYRPWDGAKPVVMGTLQLIGQDYAYTPIASEWISSTQSVIEKLKAQIEAGQQFVDRGTFR